MDNATVENFLRTKLGKELYHTLKREMKTYLERVDTNAMVEIYKSHLCSVSTLGNSQ